MILMCVRMCGVTKLDNIRNVRIRGTKKGGNHKKVQERRLKWFAIQKRGTLRRKEGDANGK